MGIESIEYGLQHERLEELLRSVDRPGDYCVGGRLHVPMPRVVVDGVGDLSFPVPQAQIEALKNTDAAVAKVLGAAADRAGAEGLGRAAENGRTAG